MQNKKEIEKLRARQVWLTDALAKLEINIKKNNARIDELSKQAARTRHRIADLKVTRLYADKYDLDLIDVQISYSKRQYQDILAEVEPLERIFDRDEQLVQEYKIEQVSILERLNELHQIL